MEDTAHPACDEKPASDLAQKTHADLVINYVAHYSAVNAISRLPRKHVLVTPRLERPFFLHVNEKMVPFEFGNAEVHCIRIGR